MQSDKILKNVRRIVKEHPEYFEALVEFERTKKLPKFSYKKRVNFTLDEKLFRKFREYCRSQGFKMSSFLEKIIYEKIKWGGIYE